MSCSFIGASTPTGLPQNPCDTTDHTLKARLPGTKCLNLQVVDLKIVNLHHYDDYDELGQ